MTPLEYAKLLVLIALAFFVVVMASAFVLMVLDIDKYDIADWLKARRNHD